MAEWRFSRSDEDWNAIGERLKQTSCPHCKTVGTLIRHGFLCGYDDQSPQRKTLRARRIFCSNRNRRQGCGKTYSIWIADKIRRFTVKARTLWTFLTRAVVHGVTEAICAADSSLSDRTWQRHWKRFRHVQTYIRTALWSCTPAKKAPPRTEAEVLEPAKLSSSRPEAEVLDHLRAVFPTDDCPIAAYQYATQTFLF